MGSVPGRWSPSTVHIILFVVGGGLVYLGEEWAIPGSTSIGIAFFSVLMIAVGIDVIVKRLGIFRIDGWTGTSVVDTYRGLAELLWGLIILGVGVVVAAVVLVGWLVPSSLGTSWNDMLLSTTGIGAVLAGAGLMILLNGLIRALAGSGRVGPDRLGGLPYMLDRLAGAVIVILGGGISALGLMFLISPGSVTRVVDGIKKLIASS